MASKPVPAGIQRPPLVEFDNVTVMKGERKVLDNISVRIQEGENVAILGPNGSGKSSFIKALTREYYPVSHENVVFRIKGQDRSDVFDLRSTLGIVSNDLGFTFTRDLSGREVVLSGFFNSVGLWRMHVTPEMEEKAERLEKFLGIWHLKDRKMTGISSGEARKFLIARALVHDPKTLVLDEPTNSLDMQSLYTFRQAIREIAQSGIGIILVTHNMADIIPEISRVILMKNGRFYRDCPKTEAITDKQISDLFNVPVKIRWENGYYYAVLS